MGGPPAVSLATAGYRAEMDTLSGFLEERCEVGAGFTQESGPLYTAYEAWAHRNGEDALKKPTFGRRLSERRFLLVHKRTGGVRNGLRLLSDPSKQEEKD